MGLNLHPMLTQIALWTCNMQHKYGGNCPGRIFPAEISSKLMHLKKVSTTFDGKRGQKVFFENKNYQFHKISKFYRLCFYKLMRMTAILSMSSGSL